MRVTPLQIRRLIESTIVEMDPRTSHTATVRSDPGTMDMYAELNSELASLLNKAAKSYTDRAAMGDIVEDMTMTLEFFRSEAMNDMFQRAGRYASAGVAEDTAATLGQHVQHLATNIIGAVQAASKQTDEDAALREILKGHKALDYIGRLKKLVDSTIKHAQVQSKGADPRAVELHGTSRVREL